MIIHRRQHRLTLAEAIGGYATGEFKIADRKTLVAGRIAAQAERPVRRAEITAAGVGIRHTGNANIGRKIVSYSQFMRHNGPEARELDRRAGPIAGEHVVGAALVGGLAVRHGANDAEFVGDIGCLLHVLAEHFPFDFRLHRAERAAVFQRGKGLGIPGFLGGHPTGQIDMDDALGGGGRGRGGDTGGAGGVLQLEEVAKRQPQPPDHSHIQEITTAGPAKMTGIPKPSSITGFIG